MDSEEDMHDAMESTSECEQQYESDIMPSDDDDDDERNQSEESDYGFDENGMDEEDDDDSLPSFRRSQVICLIC